MNEDEIKFGLRKITTLQFATIDTVVVQEDDIQLNFGFGFGLNEDYRYVGCNIRFELQSKELPFIILHVLCDFEIENDWWNKFIDQEKRTFCIPVSIATHLASLTVGTARGILHSKTENTKFNKYFLPTLNITKTFNSDIVIELTKLKQ